MPFRARRRISNSVSSELANSACKTSCARSNKPFRGEEDLSHQPQNADYLIDELDNLIAELQQLRGELKYANEFELVIGLDGDPQDS